MNQIRRAFRQARSSGMNTHEETRARIVYSEPKPLMSSKEAKGYWKKQYLMDYISFSKYYEHVIDAHHNGKERFFVLRGYPRAVQIKVPNKKRLSAFNNGLEECVCAKYYYKNKNKNKNGYVNIFFENTSCEDAKKLFSGIIIPKYRIYGDGRVLSRSFF